jgi:hypothetical protein
MTKLFASQLIYITVLGLYFFAIKIFDGQNKEFEVVLFDYPRHGPVLFLVFFVVNLFFFFKNRSVYSPKSLYSFIFFWLPFTIFLVLTAIVYFYGFVSIGAPFKKNVFINLLIAHAIAFIVIRLTIKQKRVHSRLLCI